MTGNPHWTEDHGRPGAPAPPLGGFRIGTMLAWTAVIAVCLAAFRSHVALGLLACLSLIPPTIRTSVVARKRRIAGGSLNLEGRAEIFLKSFLIWAGMTLVNVFVVAATWNVTMYWLPAAVAGLFSLTITILPFTLDRKPFDSEEPRR